MLGSVAHQMNTYVVAKRPFEETLYGDLAQTSFREILRHLSYRDLVQRSCKEASCRYLVQRSCLAICERDFVPLIERASREITYKDL
jgi:hypothetical protein